MSPQRLADLVEFTGKYGSFESVTPAGEVQLTGHGPVTASSSEKRMIAEWGHLVYEEAIGGRGGAAWGLAFSWHREGGIAGFCDDLGVYLTGEVIVTSCKDAPGKSPTPLRLTSIQLRQIYQWVDKYQSFDFEQKDDAIADSMTIVLAFAGTGKEEAPEGIRQEMLQMAGNLAAQAQAPQGAGELQLAFHALDEYIQLLHDENYAGAVELYGGSYEHLAEFNPDIKPEDRPILFERACRQNGYVCKLSIKNIVNQAQLSQDLYRFVIEFANPDGSLFSRGPCCGGSAEEYPAETQFEFQVQKVGGKFLVMDLPVYVP